MENSEIKKETNNSNKSNIPENMSKPHKKRKKKKHLFLKILLFFILLFLVYKGVRWFSNSIAEKKLNSFMPDYPFIFNNNDNYKSITEDFEVKNTYTMDGKEYTVTWSSNNTDYIKFNDNKAIVNNSSPKNQIVQISANYSILGGLGKASKTFDVNVLTKNKIAIQDVNVVDVNSVKNKSYNKDMKLTLTSNGDVSSMYGDFNQSIYTTDDCYTVLKAYQNNLKISPSCDFRLYDVIYSNDTTTYIYCLTINNLNIDDKKVYVSVNNNEDYSIESIKCNFDKDISKYPPAKTQSATTIYNLLSTTYNRTKQNTIFAYNSFGYKTINNNIYLIADYYLIYDNGEIHEVYVDIINGKIIKEVEPSKNILGKMVDATGTGIMNDTKTFKSFLDSSNNYYLMDSRRNIRTFYTKGSYNLYHLAFDNIEWYIQYQDSDDFFVQLGTLCGALINYGLMEADLYANTYLTSMAVKSDSKEFNDDPVAVDGYYNIIKAYDYYKNNFNIKSYDNKGATINLFVDNKIGTDNACWYTDLKSFFINPVEDMKYSFAKDSEILGHEYTHSVFGEYSNGYGIELSGLNEAYADIFGVFVSGYTNWKIGQNEYKRC